VIAASLAILAVAVGWRLSTFGAVKPLVPAPATAYTADVTGVKAGHLYLTFQHGTLERACASMATKLDFPVACPNLLPTDTTISGADCCVFSNPRVAPLFVLESHFVTSAGYPAAEAVPGDAGPHGHFLLIAMRKTPAASALSCASPEQLGTGPPVLGSPAYWQVCPSTSGGRAGHLMLVWERDGIEYSMSLHGDTPDNRLAIELMALNLTIHYPGAF